MSWIICFVLSLCILAVGIYFAVSISQGRSRSGKVIEPMHALMAGFFISVIVLSLPIYGDIIGDDPLKVLKTVAFSLHNTLQVFTLDADRSLIDSVNCPVEWFSSIYSGWLTIVYIVAPIMTFSFLISFFKNVTAYIRYMRGYFRDVYIFSELNEKTLTLGTDIHRNHPRALLVYTDVFDSNTEMSFEFIERARAIRAVCFKRDILAVNFRKHSRSAQIAFFTIGEEEPENINQALKLIEDYKDLPNVRLFVFSTRVESELLLTKADKGNIKVRRVNEVRSLVNRLLYENGAELFKNAMPVPGGKKKISAVLIGMGAHGSEMLKALSWYCQMDGYTVEIDAFDIDPSAEDRFAAMAPELVSPEYNGVIIPGEPSYTIRFHCGLDVKSKAFADEIMKLTSATYVLVALGNDEDNIRTAVDLRMLFERMRIHPVIRAIVYSSEERAALSGLENYRGQKYDIDFIGDIATSYSETVILSSELEADGLRRHLKWGEEQDFWLYEYNYNSSVASAIHGRARKECCVPGASKKEEELTIEERDTIELLEHRRWNAYMRSEGYIYSGSKEKSSRNDLAKMHNDLVSFNELSEEEKRKDSRVGTD